MLRQWILRCITNPLVLRLARVPLGEGDDEALTLTVIQVAQVVFVT
jgi:hypothetical protein